MTRHIKNLPVESLIPDAVFEQIMAVEGAVQVTSAIVILGGFDADGEPWLTVALDDKVAIWDLIGRLDYVRTEMLFPDEGDDEG